MSFWSDFFDRLFKRNLVIDIPPPVPRLEGDPLPTFGAPWPYFDGGLSRIPVGRAGCLTIYGDLKHTTGKKGEVLISPAWERENMMLALFPQYPKKIYVHRKMEPYLREAFRRAEIVNSGYEFQTIGCFAPRHMRHDPSLPLSLHSWAIAIDMNAGWNSAKFIDPAIEPWTPEWNLLWPSGVPKSIVEAFESVGFEWGGRWKSLNERKKKFVDPMHFQLLLTRTAPVMV